MKKTNKYRFCLFLIILFCILSVLGAAFSATTNCSNCDGDGLVCAKCGGAGDHGEGLKTCPECNGAGKVTVPDSTTQSNLNSQNSASNAVSDPYTPVDFLRDTLIGGAVTVGLVAATLAIGPPTVAAIASIVVGEAGIALTETLVTLPLVGGLFGKILLNPKIVSFIYEYALDADTYIKGTIDLAMKLPGNIAYYTKESLVLQSLPPSPSDEILLESYKNNSMYNINYDSKGMYNLDDLGRKQYF